MLADMIFKARISALLFVAVASGCTAGSAPTSNYPAQAQPSPTAAPAVAGSTPVASPVPTGRAGASATPPPQSLPAQVLPVPNDPITTTDVGYLRAEAQSLLIELVNTLPPAQQGRVKSIPLVIDSTPGSVNAWASCSSSGHAALAITDGLLDIEAHLSQARAIDEIFGHQKVAEYIQLIASKQRPKRPIVQPPAGFFDPTEQVDGRKVARQHQLLEEQLGFVLGHELAHHHMGNLPCTSAGALPLSELNQILSGTVPLFNQPNEFAADASGINTLLTMGFRRTGYHLTEAGALMTMQFFAGLEQVTPGDLVFAFENTHPPAVIRAPIIRETAAAWRLTGGRGLPYLI